MSIASHENAIEKNMAVDFCYSVRYKPVHFCGSHLQITDSPLQAFRSGFREGVKFSLKGGVEPYSRRNFVNECPKGNLARLLVWCSIGLDVLHGEWAMMGARQGLRAVYLENIDFTKISDYDWMDDYWERTIVPRFPGVSGHGFSYDKVQLDAELEELGHYLNETLDLNIVELNGPTLGFFRRVYVNPSRTPHLEY